MCACVCVCVEASGWVFASTELPNDSESCLTKFRFALLRTILVFKVAFKVVVKVYYNSGNGSGCGPQQLGRR